MCLPLMNTSGGSCPEKISAPATNFCWSGKSRRSTYSTFTLPGKTLSRVSLNSWICVSKDFLHSVSEHPAASDAMSQLEPLSSSAFTISTLISFRSLIPYQRSIYIYHNFG